MRIIVVTAVKCSLKLGLNYIEDTRSYQDAFVIENRLVFLQLFRCYGNAIINIIDYVIQLIVKSQFVGQNK